MTYIRAFMTHGHLNADLDPLNLEKVNDKNVALKYKSSADFRKLIDIEFYGFTEADLDKEFHVDISQVANWGGVLQSKTNWTLR